MEAARQFYRGEVSEPKSKNGRRDVPLSTAMAQQLWSQRGGDDELLFTSALGHRLDQSRVWKEVITPTSTSAGVPWVGFHTFRSVGGAPACSRAARSIAGSTVVGDNAQAMSQENVNLSRRFWTLFNDRDWDAWWDLLDDNVEWLARTDKPDFDIYRGHESLGAFVDTWTAMFPDIRVELTGESIDLGEQVITPTVIVGSARTTAIKVRDPYSFLFKISRGKIVRGQEFHDNEEALAAAGELS